MGDTDPQEACRNVGLGGRLKAANEVAKNATAVYSYYMSRLTTAMQLQEKRYQKFHQDCVQACSSKGQFERHFEVSRKHLISAATGKQESRSPLLNIAAIAGLLKQGRLSLENCKGEPFEIAVEGKILNYKWIDYGRASGVVERTEAEVQARVVVRRRPKDKHLVVTIYIETRYRIDGLPEVQCEDW